MIVQARIIPDLEGPEPRRSESRLDVTVPVALRPLGSTGADARLLNISSRGFMAESEAGIKAGSRVGLSLPGFPRVNALIVWSRGNRLGGEFADPIDPLAVLQAIGLEDAG